MSFYECDEFLGNFLSLLYLVTDDKGLLLVHLLVSVTLALRALAAVSTWGANNLFPIKLNYLTGIWSRESERLKTQ